MHNATGQVLELILEDEFQYVRVSCPPNMVPAPGQYLLASDGSDPALPVPLFHTDFAPQGFTAAMPSMRSWNPGLVLYLRGPLGRGFSPPLSLRKVGLVAFDDGPARLKGLIRHAIHQNSAVVLVSNSASENVPDDVEVQPLSALEDILEWADYVAVDIARENLPQLKGRLGTHHRLSAGLTAQVLVRTPVPCGGIAECGVCALTLNSEWKLGCKDGPVFDWKELV